MLKFANTLDQHALTYRVKTSGYATLTFGSSHSAMIGDTINVSGQGAHYDGSYAITGVGANTVTYYAPGVDQAGSNTTGDVTINKWLPRSVLQTDSSQTLFSSITANYISTPSASNNVSVSASTTPGYLDLAWSAPTSTGIPSDGGTYNNSITYVPYNASIATYYPETAATSYAMGGLANATSYWVTANSKNQYRAMTNNTGGVLGTTKTVRQYRSIGANAIWSASYKGNNALRTDDVAMKRFHGQYDSTQGLQKSFYGYSFAGVPSNAVVTNAYMYINSGHWFADSGGTLDIRYVGAWSSAPGTAHDGGDTLSYATWGSKTGVLGPIYLDIGKVQAYIRGQSYMTLGFHAPGNSTSRSYYGWKYESSTYYGTPIYIDYYWDA